MVTVSAGRGSSSFWPSITHSSDGIGSDGRGVSSQLLLLSFLTPSIPHREAEAVQYSEEICFLLLFVFLSFLSPVRYLICQMRWRDVCGWSSSLTFRATDQCRVQGFKTKDSRLLPSTLLPLSFLLLLSLLSPLDRVPVDCSEASGLCERGRRVSDSLHPQICKL